MFLYEGTRRMNARIAVAVINIVAGVSVWAQAPRVTLSPAALKEIADLEAEIDRIEPQTLERLAAPPDNEVQQVELLGKAMLYDKNLSVNRNEACASGPWAQNNRRAGQGSRWTIRAEVWNRRVDVSSSFPAQSGSFATKAITQDLSQCLSHLMERLKIGETLVHSSESFPWPRHGAQISVKLRANGERPCLSSSTVPARASAAA